MANRYLIETPIQLRNETEVLSYTVDISANSIKLKIEHNDPQSEFDADVVYTLLNLELTLDTFKSSKVLKSNSLLTISLPELAMYYDNDSGLKQVVAKQIKNISTFTKFTKSDNPFTGQISHIPTYLTIFVKDVEADFTEHDIMILVPNKEYNFDSNAQFSNAAPNFSHVSLLDNISATKDNSYINELYTKYNITTADHVDEVYVEPVVGIVDRSRVAINSTGQGYFRVLKSSLDGETPRIKLGFHSYSGVTEITE